jgi:RNA recognition motif-containing protein
MESKLYVGNLPYSATEEELSTLFGQAGTVTSVAIIKDRETGRSKGFAFVEMSSSDEAQKAINMLTGHMLGGRDLRVSIARPREEGGGGGGGGRSFGNRGGGYGNRGGGGGGGRRRDY